MENYIPDSIQNIVERHLCTGCGTCAGVCPHKTLSMEMTPEGIYIPQGVNSNCQACYLCSEVCPVDKENIAELNRYVFNKMPDNMLMGNFIRCYMGYSADSTIRWQATSGGVITSLLLFLLRHHFIDGALLTRVSNMDPLKAEPFIARTEKEILLAMGSKYIPVPLNQLLNQISSEGNKLVVVGLPCHIRGIRRAELKTATLRDKIIYHFGLVCSRTMSFRGWEYILRKMGVSLNDITELKYRGEGWPGGIQVTMKSGNKKNLPMLDTWFSEIFGGSFFSHYYCSLCDDVLNETSDISFADAYLPEVMKNDRNGTSILISRTSLGEELIRTANGDNVIEVSPLTPAKALKSQLFMSIFKKRNLVARIRLLKMFGRPVPRNLIDTPGAFLKPTLWDYIISPVPYINLFISKNKFMRRVLAHISLRTLAFYRWRYKRLLLYKAKEAIARCQESSKNTLKIVVTNSHANNRGDEAAQRSMINSLRSLMPNTEFTILTTSPNGLHLQEDVRILRTLSGSKRTGAFIILWTVLRSLGLRLPTPRRNCETFAALEEMARADVIVSAPGGPYFGDLYKAHEMQEHLFQLLLSKILRKPVMIYAPSMGPFTSRKRNVLRKYILNKAKIITLRDHISRKYLKDLKLTHPLVYTTADSAFQDAANMGKEQIKAIMVAEKITVGAKGDENRRILVGITPAGARWNYRNSQNPQNEQNRYNKIIAKAIDYLVDKFNAKIIFFPQLYGDSDDASLINEILEWVGKRESVRILSNKWDSEVQQAIISQMDFFIGNRYHSVIFALKGEVPTVCLAYEHKSTGVMRAARLDEFVIPIEDLTYDNLVDKIIQVQDQKEKIRAGLKSQMEIIRKRSFMNSILTTALVRCTTQRVTQKKDLRNEIRKLMREFPGDRLSACHSLDGSI